MSRVLLVSAGTDFLDEVVDGLGDVEVDVAARPGPARWRAAPLVLLDARAHTVLDAMPAHPHVAVIALTGADAHRVTDRFDTLESRFPGITVYQWPYCAATIGSLVAAAHTRGAGRPLRIAVVGGHGGAGTTTLAVALAQAASLADQTAVLIDGDPLGGGVTSRCAPLTDKRLQVVELSVDAPDGGLLDATAFAAGSVVVVDLGRLVDAEHRAVAQLCDVVLVVADAASNEAATSRLMTTLRTIGAAVALVGRSHGDHTGALVASDYEAPYLGGIPTDGKAVNYRGEVDLRDSSVLADFAVGLLAQLPQVAAATTPA